MRGHGEHAEQTVIALHDTAQLLVKSETAAEVAELAGGALLLAPLIGMLVLSFLVIVMAVVEGSY